MEQPLRVLVVTRGHPFEAEPFFAIFDEMAGVAWTHVEQPDARAHFTSARAGEYDCIVCYDMPGITFTGDDPPARFEEPPADMVADYQALLDAGQGIVFLHHAVASWPAWPGFADIVGGRFHYQPARLREVDYPDSGYRFDATHHVRVVAPDHPVCAGVGEGFTLTDELYLYPVFEDEVIPLMRSDAEFTDDGFFSADQAIRGRMGSRDGWSHPPGSDLVAWVKTAGRSPIVYLQFGDGPVTYADPNFRLVLGNAIGWAASREAHRWATGESGQAPSV
ncbi:MAG: ThuA domain-containing protein [Acidimicrobiales bacterium]